MGVYMEEEAMMKCRKHPSKHRTTGVCPLCLLDRLIRLCPDCANVRPCACYPTTSSSSSSSSFSLSSSSDVPSSGGIGSTGRMSNLIDSEPAFQRSRSAAFPFLRSKISAKDCNSSRLPPSGDRSKPSFWSSVFRGQKVKKEEEIEERKDLKMNMMRSKSVGSDGRAKGRNWYFLSPMKAFRQSKKSKIVQERSPLCRG